MIAILVDSFASTVVVKTSTNDSNSVPEDIRDNYPQILRQIGISDNLKDAENHLSQYSTVWKYNVRIFEFDALYDDEYWDVSILAIDHQKATTRFTAIFVDETGEFKIFLSDTRNKHIAMNDLREQIANKGFEWCADNVEEVFSAKWVKQNLLKHDKEVMNISGLWEIEWNKNYHENEFARLKCFIIQNKTME